MNEEGNCDPAWQKIPINTFCRALRLQSQFEELDKDKSGNISKKELKQALKKEGNLTEWEIIEFANTADKDGDGQISLEEWLDAMIDDIEDKNATKGLVNLLAAGDRSVSNSIRTSQVWFFLNCSPLVFRFLGKLTSS